MLLTNNERKVLQVLWQHTDCRATLTQVLDGMRASGWRPTVLGELRSLERQGMARRQSIVEATRGDGRRGWSLTEWGIACHKQLPAPRTDFWDYFYETSKRPARWYGTLAISIGVVLQGTSGVSWFLTLLVLPGAALFCAALEAIFYARKWAEPRP